jgi:4-carboxymuconolactone decarboxylase
MCVMRVMWALPFNGLSTASQQICRATPARKASGELAGAYDAEGGAVLDYSERLRRLAINDACLVDGGEDGTVAELLDPVLDPRTRALVRLAALVAVGGAVPSFGAQADAAVNAGATAAEIVDVLFSVVPVIGLPRTVAAGPKLALALGYDTSEELERQAVGDTP